MAGTRDTEMAIGAWQPRYSVMTTEQGGGPYGDIHAFRMSLWTEHFRHWEPTFRFPAQIECIHKVHIKYFIMLPNLENDNAV